MGVIIGCRKGKANAQVDACLYAWSALTVSPGGAERLGTAKPPKCGSSQI
jgi:hypothetical protein